MKNEIFKKKMLHFYKIFSPFSFVKTVSMQIFEENFQISEIGQRVKSRSTPPKMTPTLLRSEPKNPHQFTELWISGVRRGGG